VQGHAEKIGVRADMPALGIVEMHVARERFGIGRRRVKGMSQDSTRSIEWIAVTVRVAGEQNIDGG
jgi:hypothetical protein